MKPMSPSGNELVKTISAGIGRQNRLVAEIPTGEPPGVLVTWYCPRSYKVEISARIPPGLIYECLADDHVRLLDGTALQQAGK